MPLPWICVCMGKIVKGTLPTSTDFRALAGQRLNGTFKYQDRGQRMYCKNGWEYAWHSWYLLNYPKWNKLVTDKEMLCIPWHNCCTNCLQLNCFVFRAVLQTSPTRLVERRDLMGCSAFSGTSKSILRGKKKKKVALEGEKLLLLRVQWIILNAVSQRKGLL